MDSEQRSFVETVRAFLEEFFDTAPRERRLTPLSELVEQHLGTNVAALLWAVTPRQCRSRSGMAAWLG